MKALQIIYVADLSRPFLKDKGLARMWRAKPSNRSEVKPFLRLSHTQGAAVRQLRTLYLVSALSGQIRGEFNSDSDSRLLFLAELLETRIGAQRIPEWIDPKKRWRNRRCNVN